MRPRYVFVFSDGGFVVYGQWVSNTSFTLDIPQLMNKNVVLYLYKEGEPGNLQSDKARLNDQLLDWDVHRPIANAKGNYTTLPITLPGISQFFIVSHSDTSKTRAVSFFIVG